MKRKWSFSWYSFYSCTRSQ